MKVLALDQALKSTGWAVFENNKVIDSGIFSTQGASPIEQRLGAIWEFLSDLYYKHDFDYVAMEDCQQQKNAQTYQKLSMVKATLILWCYFNDIKYEVLAPSHWRSTLNIKGRAREEQKQNAIDYIKSKFNLDVSSDIADAICIGVAYLENKKHEKIGFNDD